MYHTRIAPSPTGDMHIGTARTAYFNWLAAKATGGTFMLRIDDTDQSRNKKEYVDVIVDTMTWFGLDYDKMVFQSSRFDRYNAVAVEFLDKGLAVKLDGGAIALKLSGAIPTIWTDSLAGDIKITTNDFDITDGMILIKSDGSPSYNWSTVIDDSDFGINFIIRGVDHITNTSKQVILFALLNKPLPKFAHLGLICSGNKPLSKRDGSSSMLHYRSAGYDPDAMLNFIARMGWGPTVDDKTTKLLPRNRMLDMFLTQGAMKSSNCGFDLPKLESFDRKYKAQKGIWRVKENLISIGTDNQKPE